MLSDYIIQILLHIIFQQLNKILEVNFLYIFYASVCCWLAEGRGDTVLFGILVIRFSLDYRVIIIIGLKTILKLNIIHSLC